MRPFPGIPYDYPPAAAYYLAEASIYGLFLLCLMDARRRSHRDLAYLLGGVLFGVMLEYLNIAANTGYVYGRFVIMLGKAPKDVPLCIGVGWGIIMYTARLVTNARPWTPVVSAAADALLAFLIDLGMDVVAYRLHMWHWDWESRHLDPLTGQWFGIPYGNFYGWLCVVFCYSFFFRLLERRLNAWAIAPAAVLLSQGALWLLIHTLRHFVNQVFGWPTKVLFIAALVILLAIWRGRRGPATEPLPTVAWLVPAWFHGYFGIWFFLGGFSGENPLLTGWTVFFLLAGSVVLWRIHRTGSTGY